MPVSLDSNLSLEKTTACNRKRSGVGYRAFIPIFVISFVAYHWAKVPSYSVCNEVKFFNGHLARKTESWEAEFSVHNI